MSGDLGCPLWVRSEHAGVRPGCLLLAQSRHPVPTRAMSAWANSRPDALPSRLQLCQWGCNAGKEFQYGYWTQLASDEGGEASYL